MMLDQIRRTIEKYRMLSLGDRVIVGVSGGMDSVALLSALSKLRKALDLSLVVAHLNHRLRGRESLKDAEFVRKMALKLGLPFEIESVAVRKLKKKGTTLQEAAREARFLFFHNLVDKHEAHKIALGQTADDQAETIVMRFLRGSGLAGLKGIPPVRDELIIHPLIEVTREQIEAYLSQEGLRHVEDTSNLKDDYLRNRIRRHLVPLLEQYNPNLRTVLCRMGQILWHEELHMREKTEAVWNQIAQQDGDRISLDLTEYEKLDPAIQFRLLRRSVGSMSEMGAKRLGVTHILNLAEIIRGEKPHAEIHLPGRITAKRVYERLEIGKRKSPLSPSFEFALALPGETPLKELGKKLVIRFADRFDLRDASPRTVFMDSQRLQPPFRLRNYRYGDRFRPLGMTGRKKIKDCFIDWKVPLEERSRIPLMLSGEAIVWVVGYRISEDVRVTPETEGVVRVEFQDL